MSGHTGESFKVLDRYGNIYLCNLEYSDGVHNINLGGTYNHACVRIQVTPTQAYLESVSYYRGCNFNRDGLSQGTRGTKSMVLTVLCITKHLHPTVSEYVFSDNSSVGDEMTGFKLYKYYLLKHGKTWYQTFLTLEDSTLLTLLYNKLSQPLPPLTPSTMQSIATGYNIDMKKITDTVAICKYIHAPCTWYKFHTILFSSNPDTKNNATFDSMLRYHVSPTFPRELSDLVYHGLFHDIPCEYVYKIEKQARYTPFGSTVLGGARQDQRKIIYRHQFANGEEDTE